LIYWLAIVGLPASVGLVWKYGIPSGSIIFSLLLIFVALVGAYLSGLLMWEIYMKPFLYRWREKRGRIDRDQGK
jgi:hypothetical protein